MTLINDGTVLGDGSWLLTIHVTDMKRTVRLRALSLKKIAHTNPHFAGAIARAWRHAHRRTHVASCGARW